MKFYFAIITLFFLTSASAIQSGTLSVDVAVDINVFPVNGSEFLVKEQANYRITVRNNSNSAAEQVEVLDLLPATVIFVSDNCGGGIDGQQWTWVLDEDLQQGELLVCDLVVSIIDSGVITNSVAVTNTAAGTVDPDLSNNSATVDLTAVAGALVTDTAVSQEIEALLADQFIQNQQAALTVTADNFGPTDVSNAQVTINLPAALEMIDSDCAVNTSGTSLVWDITGTFTTSESQTCVFILALLDAGQVDISTVLAFDDAGINELDESNNQVTTTIDIASQGAAGAVSVPTLDAVTMFLMTLLLLSFAWYSLKHKSAQL